MEHTPPPCCGAAWSACGGDPGWPAGWCAPGHRWQTAAMMSAGWVRSVSSRSAGYSASAPSAASWDNTSARSKMEFSLVEHGFLATTHKETLAQGLLQRTSFFNHPAIANTRDVYLTEMMLLRSSCRWLLRNLMSLEFEAPASVTNTFSLICRSTPNLPPKGQHSLRQSLSRWSSFIQKPFASLPWSQPVPDFLQKHFLLVVSELSRKSSGNVGQVGVSRHKHDRQRLLDTTSES